MAIGQAGFQAYNFGFWLCLDFEASTNTIKFRRQN